MHADGGVARQEPATAGALLCAEVAGPFREEAGLPKLGGAAREAEPGVAGDQDAALGAPLQVRLEQVASPRRGRPAARAGQRVARDGGLAALARREPDMPSRSHAMHEVADRSKYSPRLRRRDGTAVRAVWRLQCLECARSPEPTGDLQCATLN